MQGGLVQLLDATLHAVPQHRENGRADMAPLRRALFVRILPGPVNQRLAVLRVELLYREDASFLLLVMDGSVASRL